MEGEDCDDERQNESLSSSAICDENNILSNSRLDVLGERVNHSYHHDPKSNQFLNILNANKNSTKKIIAEEQSCAQCKNDEESYCHVDIESLAKLKDSTKKLLILLEEIQSKTHGKSNTDQNQRLTEFIKPIILPKLNTQSTAADILGEIALRQLESQAKTLESIFVEDEEDDCSVYKRLTRKCNCLNSHEYNDFVIHFNEDTNYFTNNIGEIIKNMRILKKFLYMGGNYTKRALMFLNEGLSESSHTEKADIIQGCSHADVCNLFDDHSIVTICISWPCKHEFYGNSVTQDLTSDFLYKLAQLEEGRRYLKFTSKITADIKKLLRKKASLLEPNTLDCLNATLNLMNPPLTQHINATYYCKNDEGFVTKTVGALVQYRQYMTLDEVFTHLDLLLNMSEQGSCHDELTPILPALTELFKQMLLEYDNSEMNIIITNTLNNIMSKKLIRPLMNSKPDAKSPQNVGKTNAATDMKPIITKNVTIQMPPKKPAKKVNNKTKIGLGGSTANKFRQPSLRKVPVREPPRVVNRSRKFGKESRNGVIVVPLGL